MYAIIFTLLLLSTLRVNIAMDPPTVSHQCLSSLPVFKKHPGHETVGYGVQAIFSSVVFQCDGKITSWKVYTRDMEANKIHFQVWRHAGEYLQLVGESILKNARPTANDGMLTVSLDPSEYVNVQAGDVLGIYQGNTNKGTQIRTKPTENSEMRVYQINSPPVYGTQLRLSDQTLLKNQAPIIAVTVATDLVPDEVITTTTTTLQQQQHSSTSYQPFVQPTNSPSETNANEKDTTGNGMSAVSSNSDCDNASGMFPVLVVLVMTIAILLLVVFILGTALVLVGLKLNHTRNIASIMTTEGQELKATISSAEKRVGQNDESNDVGGNALAVKAPRSKINEHSYATIKNEAIENPSYVIDKKRNRRNEKDNKRQQHIHNHNSDNNHNNESVNSNGKSSIGNNKVSDELRERADSSISTKGLPNVQEYENPLTHPTSQPTTPDHAVSCYSHPRPFSDHGLRNKIYTS